MRRDQLALGAVATALLVGIVVFAASTGVENQGTEPTPTATPDSQRPLFGGSLEPRVRYVTRSFEPMLSFVAGDSEWLVVDASRHDHLVLERRLRSGQPGGELPSRSALIFSRIFELIDPKSGRTMYDDDLYGWFKRHPDLDVGPAKPVTVAGVRGQEFDVAVDFVRPARPAAGCRRLLIACTALAPGRFYPTGTRMRTIVLPLRRDNPLVIDVVAQTQRDLDDVEAPAAEVLRTLRINTR